MAEYTLQYCHKVYAPITCCPEGDVVLCLTPEWVDRTQSGKNYVCAQIQAGQRIIDNRCQEVCYTLLIDDAQFIEDPGDPPNPYRIDCDDIVDVFPFKCIFDLLLSNAGGGITADWVVDQDNVTQNVDVDNQIFEVTFPIIDRISATPQGSFVLDFSALYTGVVASINDIGDVDTLTTPPSVGDHFEWDGANWVPTAPFTFTVNAGTTAVATDDSLGTELVDKGDILHLYSGDASVALSVAAGSAVVNLQVSAAIQNQISTNATNISVNSGNIATNTTNISNNTTNITNNTTQIGINTTNITTNTGNISVNAANITANSLAIGVNATNIATNTTNIATNTTNISTNATNIANNTTAIAAKMDPTDFIAGETPTGAIDGINTMFTLANTPVANTYTVFLNGLALNPATDYSVVGAVITLTSAPLVGDEVFVNYIM